MTLHQYYLAAHRRQLQRMRSTIRPDANVQTSSAQSWQVQTIYPVTNEQIAAYTITPGKSGLLTGLQLNSNGAAGTLRFVILINGYPLRGLQNPIYYQVGGSQPQGISYYLPQNSVVTVLCQNLGGGVSAAGPTCTLTGFEWYGGLGSYEKEDDGGSGREQGAASNTFAPGWRTRSQAGAAVNGGAYPFRNY